MSSIFSDQIVRSRKELITDLPLAQRADDAAEGGCGVLGFAANLPIAGRHVMTASQQMHNRGNGKGGGIAMVGLDPLQVHVDQRILSTHYNLQIALLDSSVRPDIEERFIFPYFDVAEVYELSHIDDYRAIPELSVRPPDVWRYFVRVKSNMLEKFRADKGLTELTPSQLEDEFIYQNSYHLNRQFYASLGDKRAFVLSHGKNLSVLKIVGYAENVVAYYGLENNTAHVWIAHQRYPTKGRVWHPGGAHPFIGLNEALVHNGDFANYHAVSSYLRQRNIGQLFLTDTEVSIQLFDLWNRVYQYPLEITLEALAPTTEFDFDMLPEAKKRVYQAVQRAHIHGSPDGPWFFIIARALNEHSELGKVDQFELLGITDTSMLRPQVFALFENQDVYEPVQIGLIASERQAINACLRSLAEEDERFQPYADNYWVARGGSHTDGGAFRFSILESPGTEENHPSLKLECKNKYGQPVAINSNRKHVRIKELDPDQVSAVFKENWIENSYRAFDDGGGITFWNWLKKKFPDMTWDELSWGIDWLNQLSSNGDDEWIYCLDLLNLIRDRRYDSGNKKRASILRLVDTGLRHIFDGLPLINSANKSADTFLAYRRLTWETRHRIVSADVNLSKGSDFIKEPNQHIPTLVIDTAHFPPEGEDAAARWMVKAVEQGWKHLIAYNWMGGRFAGAGFGPAQVDLKIDLYGDVGDYAASGLDGGQITIHADGQDQLGQIMKSGKLVIHGDAGQTFLYGAKGGEIFVLGSVAGRPLINAVGKPRAVINGTCLDYLAESFMAGDPTNGGGFVIINGMAYDEAGQLHTLHSPYPGGNLFSLASGGAIYIRDPHQIVQDEQLNGGKFVPLSGADWELIEAYLIENERLFGITLSDLLMVDGGLRSPGEVYRKVEVESTNILADNQNN